MFADTDLTACCDAYRVDEYPCGLETVAESVPQCPYMYTGALENHPDLVDRIAKTRELYGNPADVLRRVRDPFQVACSIKEEGLCPPELARHPPRNNDGRWLRKPFKSSGGDRISLVPARAVGAEAEGRALSGRSRLPSGTSASTCGIPGDSSPARQAGPTSILHRADFLPNGLGAGASDEERPSADSAFYFQQFVDGDPCSALYIAACGRAEFLGVTRQLVGAAWTGATGFQYTGSLGPLELPEHIETEFWQIGGSLAKQFGLIGLFGVDAVIAEDRVWPIEVNPRYTASVEVLERAIGIEAVAMHVQACRDGRLPQPPKQRCKCFCGKAVIYANKTLTVPEQFPRFAGQVNQHAARPAIADIPTSGQQIEAQRPVVTVFAEADSLSTVRHQLESRVRQTQSILYAST